MPDTMTKTDTAPAAVVAVLDKDLSHELLKKVAVGETTYYVFLQTGEEEGGLAVVREAPGSAPELVATDSSLVTPGESRLPKEVIDALKDILGEADEEDDDDDNDAATAHASGLESAARLEGATPTLTHEQLRKRVLDKAKELDGKLSSRDVKGTWHGQLACAWAVNEVVRRALGKPIGGKLSVLNMRAILGKRHTEVSEAHATEGMIIISCQPRTGHGHVGIVGERVAGKRRVYSNSSKNALWMHNFTVDSWKPYFKRLPVEFFDLNPAYFQPGSHPYPGLLKEKSHGEDVRTLQHRLNQLGSKLEEDGDFGKKTHDAVVTFQKKKHLEPDGIVGPKTWDALWP